MRWRERMVNDEMNLPKLFYMIRHKDVTGISGTGRVLDVVDGETS